MTWIKEFQIEVKKASDEQLKLWLGYMKLFKIAKPIEKYSSTYNNPIEREKDEKKRDKYIEIIHKEYKKRDIRRERSRERGKGKKEIV